MPQQIICSTNSNQKNDNEKVETMSITKDEALKLELEINYFKNREEWMPIGDKLYEFHSQNKNNLIVVLPEQMKILKKILTQP